jgi:purine-nucleoside phosphorylase
VSWAVTARDPMDLARQAADRLAALTDGVRHDAALVLGSGLLPALDAFGDAVVDVPVTDLPGFLPPTVAGHAGRIRSMQARTKRVLVFVGRTHLYEDRGVEAVVHGVRVAAAAGCPVTILTNASGGLNPSFAVGQAVLIRDHLNLTGQSPLRGARFVDLTDLYSARLRALVHEVDPSVPEGVYAQFRGPQYETPAEVKMAGILGADLVGMSTALEAIAVRAEGGEVLGMSLVTNAAAGISGEPLDHLEVLEVGRAGAARVGALLAELVNRL